MGNQMANMIMEKSLNALWERNRVILENISNATTPGYKRKIVAFEDTLAKAIDTIDQEATRQERLQTIAAIEPDILEDTNARINVDGNSVDSDQEFVELYRAVEQYQYMQRLLNDNYARLRYAITEGRS